MKRAVVFLCVALFILLVIEPNITHHAAAEEYKVPVYDENAVLRTNNDVETRHSKSGALIYIDPARGGKDVGYRSENQTPEKDLLMQLAVTIGTSLEKAGYRVEYSRWYDDVPACSTPEECEAVRIEQAKSKGAEYVLSLALNQDSSLHRGYSLFTQPNSPALEALAQELADQIQAIGYSRFEGIDTEHYDSFASLRDLSIPCLMLQAGYMTSPSDYSRLSDSKFQSRLASAVTRAFLNTVD